ATPRRRFRRRWAALLLGLVAIVGVVGALVLPPFLFPAPTTTIWQNITAGITDGSVPGQTALEAFAYLYQVDIPGVTVPTGVEGGDEPTDGSGALSWVQADWSSLTAAQQAVINRYLQPGPNDQTVTPNALATASAVGSGSDPQFVLTGVRSTGMDVLAAPDAPADLTSAILKEFEADIAHIGPKLGMPVITPGTIAFPNIELTMSDTSGGRTLMQTVAEENALHYEPCHLTVFKNAWQGETVTGSGGVSSELHVLITHEVIHCYQNVVWGSNAVHFAIPPWIIEGTALYLAADDTHIAEPMIPSMWTHGWFVPETPLTNRSYDAFGYYTLLYRYGRNLWNLMLPAWGAAAKNTSSPSDAFIAVLQGDAPNIRDNWAESYLRMTAWGDPWETSGFDLPDTTQVNRHPAQAQPAPGWTGSLQSRSNTVLKVDSSSGEVVTVSTDGLASVHDDSGHSLIAFIDHRFCVVASCVCPRGTKLAGEDMASDPMSIPFVAAFNAPEAGSTYSIISQTLADLCGQPTPPPTTHIPCGSACSSSNGDPHLRTVNSFIYDFQGAGEFTLLRSADGSVDIQARQEPYESAIQTGWAINTAIAARVGSHRVGVYAIGDTLQAHVDGQVVDLSSGPMDLGGGASISTFKNGFAVDFPDGTMMWTMSEGYGIFVQIKPSATLAASGSGLLGPIVPGGMGVPALPDGSQLPVATSVTQRDDILYGQFADAWRVTDSTTLFDYDSGKSTASYTIKPYPVAGKVVTLPDLSAAQTASGDSACSAISDSTLHDDCVFDVGVTGQNGFATGYEDVQSFYDSGIAGGPQSFPPESFPPVSAAPGTQPPTVVTGAVTVAKGTSIGGYAVGPDDTVYVSVETSKGSYSLISFDPKSGKVLQQVSVPAKTEVHYAAGSLWLPGLKTDSSLKNCSVTRFDASTLAEQATIAIPCADVLGPIIASDGSAIWFENTNNYHPATKKGAVATRIDPTTNAPGATVPMPSAGGYLMDSQGAIFYADTNTNTYYVLADGATAFASLGTFPNTALAAGTGLWVQNGQGKPAEYFTQSGSPDHTIQVKGTLVAGDASSVYTEAPTAAPNGGTQPGLLRYPIDGSGSTRIALPPKINAVALGYFEDPPPTVTADGFVKIWAVQSASPQASIQLQWIPLP
ncbi:MAG: hypothetical protein ACHQ01_03780, partial [Candidatus Limnocylindrales bacterium]